ncbi:hypothetical protein EGR_01282 [Echinococcus granulosus]|uniref:Uncharacterized protein n=1 Tax=Echinococcus granulosus TaxID=6210 RepID=W6VA78_ECHGR|nr:hypothetical protein EGR_01282 [Echinococcus granulosus]EUB63659.1 hypothetical protein EGR_01282 [Echinococcus granulosus]
MSLAFIKRAFSLKKNVDEHHIEDFLRWHHIEGFCNATQLSKIFRKNALRLIVVRKSNESNQPRLPIFDSGDDKVSLAEIAFGSFSLTHQKDLTSSIKLHDLRFSRHVLLTYVYYPSTRRVRTSIPASYGRKQTASASIDIWSNNLSVPSPTDLTVAICVLINTDWAHSLAKSISSGFNPNSKPTLPIDLLERFYALLFDHFLQISVSFQALSEVVGHLLTTGASNHPQKSNLNEIHEKINRAFMDFQRNFRDLCIPRLCRPVWPSLSLAYASQSDTPTGSRRLSGRGSSPYQSFPLNITPLPTHYESVSNSFVRGCLCSLISRNMSRDRCHFLAQLVTGILMQHRGWIATVMLKIQNPNADSEWTVCEALSDGFARVMTSGGGVENSLLIQYLVQSGCDLNRHSCEDAKILNTSGTALATTILYGNAGGSGLQQQQHRDRLLALLYFTSYFLRPPYFLLQAHEQLPDLGVADLYELEQRKRKSLQRPHGGSSSSRRKSSSQLSAPLMIGQRGRVVDIYDSGIASQEDLSAAVLQTLQQYSSSAGSSPNHPPVGASAICLPGRLTHEQCRIAEAAAQALVSREFAAVAAANATKPLQQQQQQQHNPSQHPSPTSPVYTDAPTSKHREHTWTMGMVGRNRKMIAGLLAASSSVGESGGGDGTGNNGDITGGAFYSSITPNVSAGVPCFSTSISSTSNNYNDLTEIPLLIEKWYDYEWDNCWCLGEGIGPAVLGKNYCCGGSGGSTARAAASPVTVHYGSSVERYSSIDNDDSVEVGTVCHADMESSDDGTQSSLGAGGGPELTLHSPISSSVLEHYTSGLALQATTESATTFRGRLVGDLASWLSFAPTLLRRAVAPPPIIRPRSRSRFSSHSPQPSHNAFRCSALLVNVDASTVELLTVKSGAVGTTGSRKRSRSSKKPTDSLSAASTSPLSFFLPPNASVTGSFEVAGRKTSVTSNSDSSTDEEHADAPASQSRILVHSPLILRLLETVKLIYDRSGGCSSIALQHLETGLQNLCILGCTLADLLVPSITSPDGGPDAPLIFKQNPETIANIIGCHRSDLPLLLSIAGSVSCKAAAVIETYELDQMW